MAKNRTGKKSAEKPAKPYPGFPLTANGNGQWSKKIRGKVFYFGPWVDPDAAYRDTWTNATTCSPVECPALATA